MKNNRQFKGVWIPAHIYLDAELSAVEKMLYAEIDSYTGAGNAYYKSNEMAARDLCVSVASIKRAIKKLSETERIEVRGGTRNRNIVSLMPVKDRGQYAHDKGQNEPNKGQRAPRYGSQRATNNIENNKVENIGREKEVVYPFEGQEFLLLWGQWKQYKKDEHKFHYKSAVSEQAALHRLNTLSNGDEQQACEIIRASITNGWKGLFAIREKTTSRGTQDGSELRAYIESLHSNNR